MRSPKVWLAGGIAGMVSICCYGLAIAIHWPDTQLGTSTSLVVVSGFPILGLIYSLSIYGFIAAERDSAANRLAILFAAMAFTTLMAMLTVQLAVVSGLGEMTRTLGEPSAGALRRGLRLIDLGLDVAWDMLMGVALIFWGVAIRRRTGLGLAWAIPSAVFGIAVIVLNVATFPWPPANRGLVDIGPAIALFLLALSARLAWIGWRSWRVVESL